MKRLPRASLQRSPARNKARIEHAGCGVDFDQVEVMVMIDRGRRFPAWRYLALPALGLVSVAAYTASRVDMPARAAPAAARGAADIGTLTPFYRGTQVQGNIPGQGLMAIPAYLTNGSTDVGYRRNAQLRTEIPFVDTFTINRFLGGYDEKQLQQGGAIWDAALGRAAGDYLVRDAGGRLVSRPAVITAHLKPYLDAGYATSAITINLENVPWAIAANGGSAGKFGQRNPPDSNADWQLLVQKFAADLKQLYGADAPRKFKIGNEYNTLKSFGGSAQQYYTLYDTGHDVLEKAIAGSTVVPGEFTGDGSCDNPQQCVYDTKNLLSYAASNRATPAYVPRSLHAIQGGRQPYLPSDTVDRAVRSYQRLGSPAPEIHQFGLLGQPFGADEDATAARDMGVRSGAWEFLTLMGLQATLRPARVFHWGGFFALPKSDLALLDGGGFVRLFLDRYLGASIRRLTTSGDVGAGSQVGAYSFDQANRTGMIVARFTETATAGDDRVVTIDLGGAKAHTWRAIVLDPSSDVMQVVRKDLAAAGNLEAAYAKCADCSAQPTAMANDVGAARRMLLTNTARYYQVTQTALRWRPLEQLPGARATAGSVTLRLPADAVVFLESAG